MKVTFYKSAGVLIESGGTRLLCDPWLEDGAYYGAWAHVPPCDITPEEIGPLDGIYITHIHPDHLHESTLGKFDKRIPVFIHHYAHTYLADAIRALGFHVVELGNGRTGLVGTGLASDPSTLTITIFGADNCDPSVCGQFFGCDAKVGAERPGSTQVDSLAVISDGTHPVVNVNDCPFELAQSVIPQIREQFGKPDLLLVNYVGAGPYPQCYASLSESEKVAAAADKRERFLAQAERYVRALEPKAFMPFAGTYTLVGKLAGLNKYRGVPTLAEAAKELVTRVPDHECVHLPTGGWYDVGTGESGGDPGQWSPADRAFYEDAVLVGRRLDYETDAEPESWRLVSLLKIAGERFRARCEAVGFTTDTRTFIQYDDYFCYRLPMGDALGCVTRVSLAVSEEPHLIMRADPRLLWRLLNGTAHWQDASIGSHVTFERRPDRYERGLEFCLNDLRV